ncbi:MAG: c-type cytochrome [Gemmatimonadota bacterium]
MRAPGWPLLLVPLAVWGGVAGEGSGVQELPDGVTAAWVARGDTVFHGAGFCFTCHGADAKGIPGLGSDLTDARWRHGDGSYGALRTVIAAGVPAERSGSGVPMPPRGGARLTDAQVGAVAAYVWVLSHR